jgi:chromate reductase
MHVPKILIIPGSLRAGSHNVRLAALAAKELTLADAEVTRISLQDFPLPIYDADQESRTGYPPSAVKLKQLVCAHHGIFITSPEYNASISPLLKNAIDWISVVREKGEPVLAAFKGRAFAIAAASPGRYGGARSLLALRQVLEVGCRALVIPEQVAVTQAATAFDETDNLKDTRLREELRATAVRLVEMARLVGETRRTA